MKVNLTNPIVISILETLSSRLELSFETVIELCIAHTNSDEVLERGKQLSKELQQQTKE